MIITDTPASIPTQDLELNHPLARVEDSKASTSGMGHFTFLQVVGALSKLIQRSYLKLSLVEETREGNEVPEKVLIYKVMYDLPFERRFLVRAKN